MTATFAPLSRIEHSASANRTIIVGAKNFSEQYILANLLGDAPERGSDIAPNGATIWVQPLPIGRSRRAISTSMSTIQARSGPMSSSARDTLSSRGHACHPERCAAAKRDKVDLLGLARLRKCLCLCDDQKARHRARHRQPGGSCPRLAPALRWRPIWNFWAVRNGRRSKASTSPISRAARSYSPTFIYRALAQGSADVITAFSSDGRIAAMDLVTLTDPRNALPHYDAVLLLSGRAARDKSSSRRCSRWSAPFRSRRCGRRIGWSTATRASPRRARPPHWLATKIAPTP